jgi:parvulin-like peptidyl-prolyl isomerase
VPQTTQQGQAGVNVALDDEARAAATAAHTRLLKGEDFATLATEVSTAPSRANGGLIGPIAVRELSEALQDILLKMKPGEITAPIRIARGYQILQLETLLEASVQPFDSVRDLVAERVHDDRERQEIRRFLARVRGQAIIEWKNAELKNAYDRMIAQSPVPDIG